MLNLDWWGAPAIALVQHKSDTQETQQQATVVASSPQEINLISCGPLAHISDIKLIRTDTTLDLSQKAEKGMLIPSARFSFYIAYFLCFLLASPMWVLDHCTKHSFSLLATFHKSPFSLSLLPITSYYHILMDVSCPAHVTFIIAWMFSFFINPLFLTTSN